VRRRLAERGMMRPAATAEAIVDALRQGLVALDASQRVVMANPAFCEMFQTDPTAIQGKSLFAIHDGVLDIPELRIVLEDSLPSGMPSAELEIRPTLPHVGKRVLRVRARRLHHVLLVIDDITERERQAEALRGSEARARAILNATADGIITTDPHGVITMWNPAAERIFGYTTDEALGRKVTMLMPSSQDSPQKSAIEHGDDHGGFIAWFRDAVPRIIGQTARDSRSASSTTRRVSGSSGSCATSHSAGTRTTTNANAWRSWYASTASVSSASSESASPTR